MVRLTGNTFPCRAQLHALGGQFVERTNSWWVPEERAAEARALVAAQPPREPRPAPVRRRPTDPAPKGWRPCGYSSCSHYFCHGCGGHGAPPPKE